MEKFIHHLNTNFDQYGDLKNYQFYSALLIVLTILVVFSFVRIREVKKSKSCINH